MREWDLPVGPRGLSLRVCEWGAPEGRPLVVLHGYLEQGAAWERFAAASLARAADVRILAPDQRGHGRSGHVGAGGWYHFWDYVGDLDVLVQHLGGEIDLLGHSMGGTVACLFAGARPEAVRRLVLVDGLGPPDTTSEAVQRARAFLDGRRRPPRHGPLADLAEAASRIRAFNGIDEALALHLAERLTEPGEGGLRWSWDPLHRGRTPNPFDAALFCTFLAQIRADVLSVEGGRSPFVLPDWDRRAAAIGRIRRQTMPESGHLIHHDAPEPLAALVTDFLEGA